MSDFREAYTKYHLQLQHILREPTEQELANFLPAFHAPEDLSLEGLRELATMGWKANQVSEIIKLLQAAEEPKDPATALSLGMDLGVYAMSKLFATGKYEFTPKEWEKFGWSAAQSLERQTGEPAEDLVLQMVPIIELAIKQAGGLK